MTYATAHWKKTMRCRKNFGISRIDSGSTHCWLVRLGYRKDGHPLIVGTFTDGVHGGKRRARAEAFHFRDKKLRQIQL